MGTEKSLVMHRYLVVAVGSPTPMEVSAAYVKNEDGFLTFKNAAHETVLMVAASGTVSVMRGDDAPHPLRTDFVPQGYTTDFYGNVSRTPVAEQEFIEGLTAEKRAELRLSRRTGGIAPPDTSA